MSETAALHLIDIQRTYHQAGETLPVLRGASLTLEPGEIVALVGPSGGGKTTVLNLIPRFYDVTGGKVTIDDHDVRDITLPSLRRQIALVTQEPFLFDDTIRANIAYAKDDATQEEIEFAARQAAAHDFILSLPKGYDTSVGEAGARLSGGFRQRLVIARSLVRDPPVLVLDEPSSNLDRQAEEQLRQGLVELARDHTVIIATHSTALLEVAQTVSAIDRGKVMIAGPAGEVLPRISGRPQPVPPAPIPTLAQVAGAGS